MGLSPTGESAAFARRTPRAVIPRRPSCKGRGGTIVEKPRSGEVQGHPSIFVHVKSEAEEHNFVTMVLYREWMYVLTLACSEKRISELEKTFRKIMQGTEFFKIPAHEK